MIGDFIPSLLQGALKHGEDLAFESICGRGPGPYSAFLREEGQGCECASKEATK